MWPPWWRCYQSTNRQQPAFIVYGKWFSKLNVCYQQECKKSANRWPMAAGSWQLAAGSWPLAAGRWQLAAGCELLATGRFFVLFHYHDGAGGQVLWA